MSDLGLPDAVETTRPRVSLVWLLAGLIGLGVAVAAVWIVLAFGVGTLNDPAAGRSATDCSAESTETLEELFGVELPEGTAVEQCSYQEFQDWHLTATFSIPGDEIELSPLWSDGGPDSDGVYRSAEQSREGDSTTLVLTMFTT
jgi:hypothetical protein